MEEILNGFNKRMEFFAIVDSIVKRRNTSDKIESLFTENKMENLIMSTLVYIMETTLTEEEECTIENISQFIKKILPKYIEKNKINEKELTRYIIKDILQNKGQSREFQVTNYDENKFEKINVRLISDKLNEENKVIYELTKQGYDFLFRTKEVDDELGFKIEEIKLKMLIHKKDYKKAVSSSRELIRKIKNKKIDLSQFSDNLRNNINNISGEKYDEMVNGMYQLLEEEYKEMKDIEILINESINRIKEEENINPNLDEKTKKAKNDIWTISRNVRTVLDMQIDILTQCKKVKKLYMETLKESMEYSLVKTYNFKEEILDKLEKAKFEEILEIYAKLLKPLFLPRVKKNLNINLIYDNQTKLESEQEEKYSIEQELLKESKEIEERIKKRNKAHIEVINTLLNYASIHKEGFTFKDYIQSINENENLADILEENLIFMQMLKLYAIGSINIEEWEDENTNSEIEANGEFDLSYCLRMIKKESPNFYGVKKITIKRTDEKLEFEQFVLDEKDKAKVEMTNFKIEVE